MSSARDFSQAAFPPFVNQLLQSGYLSLPQVQLALIEKRQSQRSLTEIIESITGHLLPPELLKQYRQEQLFILKILHGIDVIDPETKPIIWSQIEPLLDLIPIEFCRHHQILPLARRDGTLMIITLAMVNPDHAEILEDLRQFLKVSNVQFERKVMRKQDYHQLLKEYLPSIPSVSPLKEQDLETLVEMTQVLGEIQPSVEYSKPPLENKLTLNQAKIAERLQEVEKLLTLACQAFDLLKKEFHTSSAPVFKFAQSDSSHTVTKELQDARHWDTLVKELVSDKENIISEDYEELNDPGDWEKLREELKTESSDRLVTYSVKPSITRSVPDPWF